MAFQWPTLPDIQYRLTRLRRLIVLGTLLPIAAFLLVMVIRWLVVGEAQGGLVLFSIFTLLLISAHAVLFPNATTETMMISVGLVILIVAAPLAGNSILGWLVLILGAAIFAIFGQGRLLRWQMGSKKAPTILTASIRTTAPKDEVLATFAEQPDRTQPDRRSGPVDAEGRFPVYLTPPERDIFEDFGIEEDQQPYMDSEDADEDAEGTDLAAIGEDIPGIESLDPDDLEPQPDYWARITESTPDYRKASILIADGLGGFTEQAVIEHRVDKAGKGWKLTETETLSNFEQGMSLGMWITDYQKDALIMRRDRLEGRPERSIRHQPNDSVLAMIGRAFMRRMARNSREGMEADAE